MPNEELAFRQMPHSVEAEQAVLGSILIDPRCVADVIGVLRADEFYVEANKNIFETVFSMFNYSQKIDAVTVLNELRSRGYANEGSRDYLMRLMEITPTAANVMEYAAIIKDKALLRSVADAGTEISALALEAGGDGQTVLDSAEQKVYAIRQGRSVGGLEPVKKVLVDVYTKLNEAAKSGARIPGMSTGLPDVDTAIMGLNNSDLIIIASRPGMGKTTIALNMALHVAKTSGKAVAVFSLEMSREQLCMRLLASESFVDNKKLQTGQLSEEEWRKIAAATASIGATDMRFDDNPTVSVADMNAACRRVPNLGLVVIDYLQLMQSAGGRSGYTNESRTQAVSDISRMLKIMAKELNVPVICLSQLNRANEGRQNKRPMLSDLRESGAIEQDADIILGLYRDDYYNSETETPNVAECIILKNRRGETGTVELRWLPEYSAFSSIDRRHEE
ncbi:MAG: replicative DNA helicase [Oscillospiraceae bacterium]|nr:replicative DNA helicase [Oscillospiraceae bacterium]MBQ2058107.1 replicative DNA helicase [Oscillospiraceae bacterium]MBQ2330502.1 replicative DNA helicase [Oscillospiraceae bacterium]MBQ3951787.1 replicative DNA helicase [Oscillospiraceae bacterium]MBQ3985596.1 replicative DNA helicase [Oscillospiraceae bacterium]